MPKEGNGSKEEDEAEHSNNNYTGSFSSELKCKPHRFHSSEVDREQRCRPSLEEGQPRPLYSNREIRSQYHRLPTSYQPRMEFDGDGSRWDWSSRTVPSRRLFRGGWRGRGRRMWRGRPWSEGGDRRSRWEENQQLTPPDLRLKLSQRCLPPHYPHQLKFYHEQRTTFRRYQQSNERNTWPNPRESPRNWRENSRNSTQSPRNWREGPRNSRESPKSWRQNARNRRASQFKSAAQEAMPQDYLSSFEDFDHHDEFDSTPQRYWDTVVFEKKLRSQIEKISDDSPASLKSSSTCSNDKRHSRNLKDGSDFDSTQVTEGRFSRDTSHNDHDASGSSDDDETSSDSSTSSTSSSSYSSDSAVKSKTKKLKKKSSENNADTSKSYSSSSDIYDSTNYQASESNLDSTSMNETNACIPVLISKGPGSSASISANSFDSSHRYSGSSINTINSFISSTSFNSSSSYNLSSTMESSSSFNSSLMYTSEDSGIASSMDLPLERSNPLRFALIQLSRLTCWVLNNCITRYLPSIRPPHLTALQIGISRDTDVTKWIESGVHHVTMVDRSSTCIDTAKRDHHEATMKGATLSVDWVKRDFTREIWPHHAVDIACSHLALHKAMDSPYQAEFFAHNVASSLREGSCLVTTVISACKVLSLLRRGHDGRSYQTPHYILRIHGYSARQTLPKFGVRITLQIGNDKFEDSLVQLSVVDDIFSEFKLRLLSRRSFLELFDEACNYRPGLEHLERLQLASCLAPARDKLSPIMQEIAELFDVVIFRKTS